MATVLVIAKRRRVKPRAQTFLYPEDHPMGFTAIFWEEKGLVASTLFRMLKSSAAGAKARHLAHTIKPRDLEQLWVLQGGRCALTGIPMTYDDWRNIEPDSRTTRYRFDRISIDRIDSARSYEAENVHLVCAAVNIMKGELPMRDFLLFCKAVAAKHPGPVHF